MSLVEYAKKELDLAGLMDKDGDYNGELGKAALQIVEVFAGQGHSGNSAGMLISIVTSLMSFKPLTDLGNPFERGEYVDQSVVSGLPPGTMLQSTRNPSVFSKDGGKTWYDLDAPKETAVTKRPPWNDVAASAYRAYAASTGNKNFRGEPMPAFEELPIAIRTAWHAAVHQAGEVLEGGSYGLDVEQSWAGWTIPPYLAEKRVS